MMFGVLPSDVLRTSRRDFHINLSFAQQIQRQGVRDLNRFVAKGGRKNWLVGIAAAVYEALRAARRT